MVVQADPRGGQMVRLGEMLGLEQAQYLLMGVEVVGLVAPTVQAQAEWLVPVAERGVRLMEGLYREVRQEPPGTAVPSGMLPTV